MEARNLADLYDHPLLDWGAITASLDAGVSQAPETGGPNRHTFWLGTINPDGSPHVTGVGVLWLDGAFWISTGETSRKGRNLGRDPRCTMSVALDRFDLVAEGEAHLVEDPAVVADVAARWAADGWPAEVDESGRRITADYSAQSAGPPPWAVYRMTVQRATALGTSESGGATRWTFSPS
jgi:hypothetical protein